MYPLNNLRHTIDDLPFVKNPEGLEATLRSIRFASDLGSVPYREVDKAFRKAMLNLWDRSVEEFTADEIRTITTIALMTSWVIGRTPPPILAPGATMIGHMRSEVARKGAKTHANCEDALSREKVPAAIVESFSVIPNPEDGNRIDLSLLLSDTDQSQEDYLLGKIGAEERFLINRLKFNGADLSRKVPQRIEASVFTDTSGETELRRFLRLFEAGSYDFVDDFQAICLCIELVVKAREAGVVLKSDYRPYLDLKDSLRVEQAAKDSGFSDAEATVLRMLSGGMLRARLGGFYLNYEGRLSACEHIAGFVGGSWPLGCNSHSSYLTIDE